MRPLAVIDFETEPIDPLAYPPRPVGVALSYNGRKKYLAWGHPSDNNCAFSTARAELRDIYETHDVLFHNAQFDLDVGETGLGLWPKREWHCTLLLAFLADPHAPSLGLKELSEAKYGIKPIERDELKTWILAHVPQAKGKKKDWAAYISYAPGDVVAPYAIGDVARPRRLFRDLTADVFGNGMQEAYNRERRLVPCLLAMSRRGVPVNRRALARDLKKWSPEFDAVSDALRRHLKSDVDLDSNLQLADALERAGLVDEWIMTTPSKSYPAGQRSTSVDALREVVKSKEWVDQFERRSLLKTYLAGMRLWLKHSERDGLLHPVWNPTRQADRRKGARTGRLSSEPNLQNQPKKKLFGYPFIRRYIVPGSEMVLIDRDYNQQEYRIVAHYESGVLLNAYQSNPNLDMHQQVRDLVQQLTGLNFERKHIKNVNFGILYGAGAGRLADMNGTDVATAKLLKSAVLKAITGVKDIIKNITAEFAAGRPIYTWGGRRYYCEPGRLIRGRFRTFEYRGLNNLVQGSAADCTKEAMCRAHNSTRATGGDVNLILSVHDQLTAWERVERTARQMRRLRAAMESVEFDLKMTTEPSWSRKSFGDLQPYEDD